MRGHEDFKLGIYNTWREIIHKNQTSLTLQCCSLIFVCKSFSKGLLMLILLYDYVLFRVSKYTFLLPNSDICSVLVSPRSHHAKFGFYQVYSFQIIVY